MPRASSKRMRQETVREPSYLPSSRRPMSGRKRSGEGSEAREQENPQHRTAPLSSNSRYDVLLIHQGASGAPDPSHNPANRGVSQQSGPLSRRNGQSLDNETDSLPERTQERWRRQGILTPFLTPGQTPSPGPSALLTASGALRSSPLCSGPLRNGEALSPEFDTNGLPSRDIELLYHFQRDLLPRFYETSAGFGSKTPAIAIAAYALKNYATSQLFLATVNLDRDLMSASKTVTIDCLGLHSEGLRRLDEQFQAVEPVSNDCVLAALQLWIFEAKFDFSTHVTTHIDGLQRLILFSGGLKSLRPETLWLLTWCISALPGYLPPDESLGAPSSRIWFQRFVDLITEMRRFPLSASSPLHMLGETSFSLLRLTLCRLRAQFTPQSCLSSEITTTATSTKSTSLLASLLLISSALLSPPSPKAAATTPPELQAEHRRRQLVKLQRRLLDHALHRAGSAEKTWHVLMTSRETPTLQLHEHAWAVAQTLNVLKHLYIDVLDSLSLLLLDTLLGETTEDSRFEQTLLRVTAELEFMVGGTRR